MEEENKYINEENKEKEVEELPLEGEDESVKDSLKKIEKPSIGILIFFIILFVLIIAVLITLLVL